MLRASLSSLLSHKVRLAMTALAIALGVAFMSGTFTFTATLQHDLDNLFTAATAGTDVIVRHAAPAGDSGGNAGARATIPADLLATVRSTPGVRAADGAVLDQAQLSTKDGQLAGAGAGLATSWRGDAALDAAFPLHAGRAPQADDEVVIDQTSATSYGYRLGDPVGVVVQGQSHPFRIVGIAGFGTGNGPGRSLTIFTTATAQRLFDKADRYDEIDVVGDGTAGALRQRVESGLPAGVEAVTGADVAADQSTSVRGNLGFLTDALLAFAGIALFVGGFVIWNTFAILLAQRTRELALLRAIGASRRQVFGSVLVEAVTLGVVSSGFGVGLGLLAAQGLTALISTFGLDLPSAGPRLPAGGTALAVLTGTLVTVLAALGPAGRATRIPPVAAMRDSAPAPRPPSARRLAAGAALTAAGVAALVVCVLTHPGPAALIAGAGALVIVFGVNLLTPAFARPVLTAIGAPLSWLPRRTGRLARDNARHNPRRTAATAAALTIGLAAVAGTTVLIQSVRATADASIGRASRADLYVTAASADDVLNPAAAAAIRAQPGVATISEVRRSDSVVAGGAHQAVYGIDPATISRLTDLGLRTGSLDALDSGQLLVSTQAARGHHWRVGSTVDIQFGQAGERTLTVGGTFADKGPLGDYLLGMDTFDEATGRPLDNLILVKASPGTDLPALRSALTGELAGYPGAKVLDTAGYRHATAAGVDQLLNLTTALLVLGVIIALLGIVNTLALSVTERTREIGVLRAIGMYRGQLAATVTIEAGIIAVFGGLLGTLLGIGIGTALGSALTAGTPTFDVPVGRLAGYLVVSVAAAMLAAAAPARRASRMDLLDAIATE